MLQYAQSVRRLVKIVVKSAKNDISNFWRYGSIAPLYAERIWVNAQDCEKAIHSKYLTGSELRADTGKVLHYDFPEKDIVKVEELDKVRYCIEHWVNGIPWEDTGAYEYTMQKIQSKGGKFDGCLTIDDVVNRFSSIDKMFDTVRKEGRLRSRKELNPCNFREMNGVYVHIGPDGKLFFGRGGNHRFAIALILDLRIPAQIGCVHYTSFYKLPELRTSS